MFYYKIIGHLEDDEQEVGTLTSNINQSTCNLEKWFRKELFLANGYDLDSNKEVYIDYIFYSDTKIMEQAQ